MNGGRYTFNWRLDQKHRTVLAMCAILLQSVFQILAVRKGSACLPILVVAVSVALFQVAAARCEGNTWRIIETAISMTLFGGLGMVLGRLIDSRAAGEGCGICQGSTFANWSNGLMLIFCLSGCRIFICPSRLGWIARFYGDCLCMISMTAGMVGGGFLVTEMFSEIGGQFAARNLGMLLGMFFGNLSGLCLFALLNDRGQSDSSIFSQME